MYQIQIISTEETYPIRKEVLRKGIDLPYAFNGDKEADTFHLGAFFQERLVGVSSFMKVLNPSIVGETQFQLRGMATLAEFQKKGVGKALLTKAFMLLYEKEIDVLWCNARVEAVPFYQKQGFRCIGSLFQIKSIGPHFVMFKSILNE